MKRLITTVSLLAAGTAFSAGADDAAANPHEISLTAARAVESASITADMAFKALAFTSGDASTETNVYLTADGTASGGQLDLTSRNLYFDGAGTTVIQGGNVKSDTTVNATYNKSSTGYAFVVAEGSLVLDGAALGNIKQNISVGTAYTGMTETPVTLTLKNGATLETTAYYNGVGGNGTQGVINLQGAGTTLKTQQITLGTAASGLVSYTESKLKISDSEFYWTPKALCTQTQYESVLANLEKGSGTINVSDGAKMFVGVGNTDYSTNKLQIFNGTVNVDGAGSELILAENSYLTMDPNYGTLAETTHFSNAINVTNGGKVSVRNANGENANLRTFSIGKLYGNTYDVDSALNVSGEGSDFSVYATNYALLGGALAQTGTSV